VAAVAMKTRMMMIDDVWLAGRTSASPRTEKEKRREREFGKLLIERIENCNSFPSWNK
jgi:hypothetical protein